MGKGYISKMFFKERKNVQKKNPSHLTQAKKDCCVLCGKMTDYDVTVPIGSRNFYVSGCGQLCEKCFSKMDFSD